MAGPEVSPARSACCAHRVIGQGKKISLPDRYVFGSVSVFGPISVFGSVSWKKGAA